MYCKSAKINTSVIFSDENKRKRYSLKREWGEIGKLTAILFNPSYAGVVGVDKSTMICINQAIKLGCEKFELVNLYSSVSKSENTLNTEDKIFEEKNLQYISDALRDDELRYILIGWGEKPGEMLKNEKLKELLYEHEEKLITFKINTVSKQPKHPSKGIEEERAEVYKARIVTTRINTIKFCQGNKVEY